MEDVASHATKEDCWVILHDRIYDLTHFLSRHPGGAAVILKVAGRDGTAAFAAIHPPDMVDILPESACVGQLDPEAAAARKASAEVDPEEKERRLRIAKCPPLEACFNLMDFESAAQTALSPEAWAYYSSGSDDEISLRDNRAAFQRIWLRPRVMVNVLNVDISTHILGHPASLPLYISATALGRLGHPDGEIALTRGAATTAIPQMLPTLASCSLKEMTDARADGQVQFYQLYVAQDRDHTARLIRAAEDRGCKGLFITVDAPQLGRREKDMRMKFIEEAPKEQDDSTAGRNEGAARAISSFIHPGLAWEDIPWFRSITRMPIILKGIQCGEDAVKAAHAGVDGIVLSNHGGRQMDTAPSGIEALAESVAALSAAGVPPGQMELYMDGGVRRGSDIFKALALGATAVGIGRPLLYAMSAYGSDGVVRAIRILQDELIMTMRLMGTPTVQDIQPGHVNARMVSVHSSSVPEDSLSRALYKPLVAPKSKL
ncbi:FMN-dependent dehydrogenase-domain-containing protein [Piptocephalis cylindrospora]|uniref:L-lactate dehydrogenase (cytochrome) n=1 Tax=Piptocephalis cylindrospora TaxID=1907219 RepID=A0A4P9Y0G9_9FUNG|nr:FMN-dependent dehydrogenase-domain-containing protein [Piptocephalis cylindrospora]|eukprot:RKP12228.1 FMN-dependent dehydrogenase-domain-containing protein [Piptocephalis cylindrospora]